MTQYTPPTARFIDEYRLELRSRYHAGLVQQLKNEIPQALRFWDQIEKVWLIESTEPHWLEVALRIFTGVFPYADVIRSATERTPVRAEDAYRALWLLPGAPTPVVRASYLALVKINHPDRGGDTSEMQRINGAYATLQEAGAA